jgi:hypothetical protein
VASLPTACLSEESTTLHHTRDEPGRLPDPLSTWVILAQNAGATCLSAQCTYSTSSIRLLSLLPPVFLLQSAQVQPSSVHLVALGRGARSLNYRQLTSRWDELRCVACWGRGVRSAVRLLVRYAGQAPSALSTKHQNTTATPMVLPTVSISKASCLPTLCPAASTPAPQVQATAEITRQKGRSYSILPNPRPSSQLS